VSAEGKNTEQAGAWLEKAMTDKMGEVLNGPRTERSRVPVEVETQIDKT
jgi:hypothetical protein